MAGRTNAACARFADGRSGVRRPAVWREAPPLPISPVVMLLNILLVILVIDCVALTAVILMQRPGR